MDPSTRLDGEAFDAAAAELLALLGQLRAWFAEHGPSIWVPELDQDLALLSRDDRYGLRRFLGHFGSMGSIGDIGVGPTAEPLLSRAYLLARVLDRSLD